LHARHSALRARRTSCGAGRRESRIKTLRIRKLRFGQHRGNAIFIAARVRTSPAHPRQCASRARVGGAAHTAVPVIRLDRVLIAACRHLRLTVAKPSALSVTRVKKKRLTIENQRNRSDSLNNEANAWVSRLAVMKASYYCNMAVLGRD